MPGGQQYSQRNVLQSCCDTLPIPVIICHPCFSQLHFPVRFKCHAESLSSFLPSSRHFKKCWALNQANIVVRHACQSVIFLVLLLIRFVPCAASRGREDVLSFVPSSIVNELGGGPISAQDLSDFVDFKKNLRRPRCSHQCASVTETAEANKWLQSFHFSTPNLSVHFSKPSKEMNLRKWACLFQGPKITNSKPANAPKGSDLSFQRLGPPKLLGKD